MHVRRVYLAAKIGNHRSEEPVLIDGVSHSLFTYLPLILDKEEIDLTTDRRWLSMKAN